MALFIGLVGIAGFEPTTHSVKRLLLYPLSYIQEWKATDRRHAVLHRSRASEAYRTSTVGDHDVVLPVDYDG
jgi:hypothetical protein